MCVERYLSISLTLLYVYIYLYKYICDIREFSKVMNWTHWALYSSRIFHTVLNSQAWIMMEFLGIPMVSVCHDYATARRCGRQVQNSHDVAWQHSASSMSENLLHFSDFSDPSSYLMWSRFSQRERHLFGESGKSQSLLWPVKWWCVFPVYTLDITTFRNGFWTSQDTT